MAPGRMLGPMPLVPPDSEVPELLETGRFRLRPLSVHHVVKDYDAVMTSREHMWEQFGGVWGWPAGYDAEVWLWVRASELDTGLDAELYATVRRWLEERWPFRRVAYPGRELPLDRYQALPDR